MRALAAILLLLAGCGKDRPKCGIIHAPATGACPAGYELVPDMFELRGKTSAGCVDNKSVSEDGVCIDVLRPGESMRGGFLFNQRPSPAVPGREL